MIFLLLAALASCGDEEAAETADRRTGQDSAGSVEADTATDTEGGDAAAATAESEAEPEPVAEESPYTIWDGEPIVFTKEAGADPTLAENQDRITDSVWITRGNSGGQIFNIRENNSFIKPLSPVGTAWALGTTEQIEELEFSPFRPAVGSPREVVGKELVLHIIEEDVYLDVFFESWSQEKRGGFSYRRSTRP